jgi:hypothetical protein
MSFAAKIKQSRRHDIHIIRCKDIKNRDCYYVVKCPVLTLRKIIESTEDIEDLNAVSEILAKGFGDEPDASVWAMLEEKFSIKKEDFA